MTVAAWPAPETTRAAWDVASTVAELAGTVLLVLAAAALVPLLLALVGRRRGATPLPDPTLLGTDAGDDAASAAGTDRHEVSSGAGR